MPNRILREGILTSRRVNRLKPQGELFYRRVMSVVDDFGRFSADPSLLRASCFPLRLDEVREADISRWLAEVQTAGLIALYAVNQEPYLELLDFRQQRRALKSKFPPPPEGAERPSSTRVADAQHLHTKAEAEAESRGERREAGEHEGGSRPPGPPARAAGKPSGPGGKSGRPPGKSCTPPTEAEWVAYALETWPDWQGHDVRSAWGHYQALGWKGVVDWKASAKTCYHRQAARETAGKTRPLVGAHPSAPRPRPAAPAEALEAPPPGGGVWPRVLEALRPLVDERDFDTWFRGTRQVGELNGVLRIAVAPLFLGHAAGEYGETVASACRACGVQAPVQFVAEEAEVLA